MFRMMGLAIVFLIAFNFRFAECVAMSRIQHYEDCGVVPDVISNAPSALVQVTYPNGVNVIISDELTPTQVKDIPTAMWEADSRKFYTLAMTDPDVPSRLEPKYREWHHWLVGNIPGTNVAAGETLSAYVGAGPPPLTGLHRYVFLVYEQPGILKFDEPRLTNTSTEFRAKFSISSFAKKYNLGDPIAANYFTAQYDDYVPHLYKQLGE